MGTWKILEQIKQSKVLEPYINHIRFPYYRNLEPNLIIKFDFPITAIVGQNGTNKSSILRAIYGCPKDYSVGNFWFSTEIDPIKDEKGKPRFIYSYYQPEAKRYVEVMKKRVKYINRLTKRENPDYWEPSRPQLSDDMEKMPNIDLGMAGREKTRWKLMEKNVVFMDFRSEISAYDKFFYHGDLKQTLRNNTKQDFIRNKSIHIKTAIEKNLKTKPMYAAKKEHIFSNINFPVEQVKFISNILGREYSEIRLLKHKFFKLVGSTIILSSRSLKYSEAFAGSGEFAVATLVHKICSADKKSLIILDEPEVSLHPGAQERLVWFLMEMIKKNKHQIIIGTHSPFIIKHLPKTAIKTLFLDPTTNSIKAIQETPAEEAFFHLEISQENKKVIFVEDRLAEQIVHKALKSLGQAIHETFEVKYLPGGANTLLKSILPAHAKTGTKGPLFLMDGDQRGDVEVKDSSDLKYCTDDDLSGMIKSVLGCDLPIETDSGTEETKKDQIRRARIKILRYCENNLKYLPGDNPEQFIWENMSYSIDRHRDKLDSAHDYKDKFKKLCELELAKAPYEKVNSEEIFQQQARCLATVEEDRLSELSSEIKSYIES
ncbi:ATP-dependent nuclease [Microbulbifer sp. SSSA008]|uniref:ATP-dependent nuclease n=1 Tax=Microbulbifer sp. SSSA008 TaxID=3243380 RepID=UPI004039B982